MDENLRFIAIIDSLKEKGIVSDYVQIAKELETNKAAISDIKAGRKKLSIDLLRRLKKSYPSCSIEWVVTGEGSPFITPQPSSDTPSSQNTELFLNRIAEQAEEIGRLKARIEELERERPVPITPKYVHSTSKETVEP
jgi:hypothetical protein